MSSLTGAEQVVKTLNEGGVKVMFANPGTTEMAIVEALDTVGEMKAVLGLHENVVTGAADGYGRMTGKPAATLLHLGVGLTNGLANLHNARRAGSPIINIVGEMSTWHRKADPLLAMDIEGLSGSVSKRVLTINSRSDVADQCNEALSASAGIQSGASRISTLIVPQNVAAEKASVSPEAQSPTGGYGIPEGSAFTTSLQADKAIGDNTSSQTVASAITALNEGSKCCLFIGGKGLWAPSLEIAGAISSATGATLMCENAFPRIDRGGNLPAVHRLAYFPNDAQKELQKFNTVIFIGARVPVAMFGYDDMISELVDYNKQSIIEFNTHDVPGALKHLAGELKVDISPSQAKKAKLPNRPKGKLNPSKLCSSIAVSQPEGTILIDESLTSGGSYWQASQACPQFSHLTLTGGAIGQGPPLATGAAIAFPDRRVINFQADGSGLYTAQALWTQAREKLNVTTVICSNKVYQILKIEQNKQKLSQTGSAAMSLTNLGNPDIDWVSIAKGFGVEAVSVKTCEDFLREFESALSRDGPFLIEACL